MTVDKRLILFVISVLWTYYDVELSERCSEDS